MSGTVAVYSSFVADMGYQLQRKAQGIAWTAPLTLGRRDGGWRMGARCPPGAHEKRVLVAIGSSDREAACSGRTLVFAWYHRLPPDRACHVAGWRCRCES